MSRPTDRKLAVYPLGVGRVSLVGLSDLPDGIARRVRRSVYTAAECCYPIPLFDDLQIVMQTWGRCMQFAVLRETREVVRAACATKSLCGSKIWRVFVGDPSEPPVTPWLAVRHDDGTVPGLAAAIAWAWMLNEQEAKIASRA